MKGGDFEETFSFTHAGLCKLFADSYEKYDIRVIDPLVDADRRGILDGVFDLAPLAVGAVELGRQLGGEPGHGVSHRHAADGDQGAGRLPGLLVHRAPGAAQRTSRLPGGHAPVGGGCGV